MSKCSKKCNEIKKKIDSISGLDDKFVFKQLCKIENIIYLINQYADADKLNGTCFKDHFDYKLNIMENKENEVEIKMEEKENKKLDKLDWIEIPCCVGKPVYDKKSKKWRVIDGYKRIGNDFGVSFTDNNNFVNYNGLELYLKEIK